MKARNFIKNEFSGFSKQELFFFSSAILIIALISFFTNGSKIALISAVCGISYTILAGKGKVSCYFIGMTGTLCYCYLAFKNGFFGHLALYGLYYFPMEIIGIFKWLSNYKKNEIIKTKLSKKEKFIYFSLALFLSFLFWLILTLNKGNNPFLDSFSTIFSILGLFLTVKRCIEQWYIWFFVNVLSFIMWVASCIKGSNCFAMVIMWGIYIFLAIYFLKSWKKQLNI